MLRPGITVSILFLSVSYLLLIPVSIYSQAFTEYKNEAGLNFITIPGTGTNGVAVADFNRNGCLDVYFVVKERFRINDQRTWNRLFRNNCDGTFTNITSESEAIGTDPESPPNYMGSKFGASWGDINNNGFPDLFLTYAGYDQLYQNNGGDTFTDISNTAGIKGKKSQVSTSAVWFDYNNNGLLDLYVSVWEDVDQSDIDLRNRMYKNLGDGTFEDVSEMSGLADEGRTWTSLPIDVNKNGLMDLYVVNDFGPNKLYLNFGDGIFQERTEDFGLQDRFEGMGVATADLNQNGFFDIFVTNNTEKPFNEEQINALFVRKQNGSTYTNEAASAGVDLSGWGWGAEFIDHNNNGFYDLFVTNGYFDQGFHNRFFRNSGKTDSIQFQDVSFESGLADSTEGRGVAVFDFNQNGRSDILVSNFQTKPFLYRNDTKSGYWLSVNLEGTESNRNGIGAVVELHTKTDIYTKYKHGVQFLSQNQIPLHFGLADNQTVDMVKVRWPRGVIDEYQSITANQIVTISESEGLITSAEYSNSEFSNRTGNVEQISNYPNPFNGISTIQFRLKKPETVTLSVYNILGQRVYLDRQKFQTAGMHSIRWEMNHPEVHSGVYIYHLKTGEGFSATGRMTYVK